VSDNFQIRRFQVPLADDISRASAGVDELKARVHALLASKRLRGLAMPDIPEYLKAHIQVEWEGRKYYLSDLGENIPEEELSLVPPANADKLDDETLRGLSQFFHAELAAYRDKLADLQADRDIARANLKQTKKMILATLKGEIDPSTDKKYTDAARKQAAETDPRVEEAEERVLIGDTTYDYASAIVSGRKDIVESLNRQRMARDSDSPGLGAAPGRERRSISPADRRKLRRGS
jgi:hypothetical protein